MLLGKALGRNMEKRLAGAGGVVEKDVTEAMAIFYAAAELCRRDWRVFLPISGRVRGYDFVAWKGDKSRRVEVKGLRSNGPFAWGKDLEPDVTIVGVRALDKGLVEYYIGTAKEYNSARRRDEQDDWKPWQKDSEARYHWRDNWGKFR